MSTTSEAIESKPFKSAENYFENMDYEKALPLLISLAKTDSTNEKIFHMLGTVYYSQGQFKLAIKNFQKALEINPRFTDSSIGLSVILNDLGKYEEAQKVFLTAQNLLNKKAPSQDSSLRQQIAQKHLELCHLYQQVKEPHKALIELSNYESLIGQNESVVYERFKILKSSAQFEKAAETLKDWIKKSESPNPNMLFQLAETYYLNRQPLAALSTCEKVLKYSPKHSEALVFYDRLKNTTFDLR